MSYRDGIETERLVTRFLKAEDAGIWKAFLENKEATELFPPAFRNNPEEQAVTWIERQQTRYKENRYGLQALIDKKTGTFIGQCGLITQDVDGVSEVEVGYHIMPQYWGKGFAPEAARAFFSYAFEELSLTRVISLINIHNTKSQRVAVKNGLTIEKQTVWNEIDVHVWRTDRDTFIKHLRSVG